MPNKYMRIHDMRIHWTHGNTWEYTTRPDSFPQKMFCKNPANIHENSWEFTESTLEYMEGVRGNTLVRNPWSETPYYELKKLTEEVFI
jgi:hypothetical protein